MYAIGQNDAIQASSLSSTFSMIAIAASAGGIDALGKILAALPENFPVPIVVVQHIPPSVKYQSRLAELLQRRTALTVKWAEDGETFQRSTIYIAPQDNHLVVGPEKRFRLFPVGKVNFTRPAADPLFQSLALHFGERIIAVVLTGFGEDGARGAAWIKHAGGRVIVQDLPTSVAFGMPAAALAASAVALVLPVHKIADALIALVMVDGVSELFRIRSRPPFSWEPYTYGYIKG